tara:strand:+ start:69 stop:2267 length:2199 start_codon:yes stop_codon:yes gene_type:complete
MGIKKVPTKSIKDVLKEVEEKKIVLPDFQRKYTWNKKQVIEYLNSLYKIHPTGSFLFWDAVDKKTKEEKRFLCDGQQRITSLFYVINDEVPKLVDDNFRGVKPNYKLYFNPYGNGEITDQKPSDEEVATLPVTELLTNYPWKSVLNKIKKSLKEIGSDEATISHIEANLNQCKNILDYEYAYDVLETDDLNEAVEIFNNVNQKGTKLTPGDLAYASVSSRVDGFRTLYDTFEIEIENEFGFRADAYFYMRLLSVMCGEKAKIESNMYKYGPNREKEILTEEELLKGWGDLQTALRTVLSAFKDKLGVEDYRNEIPVALYSLIVICSYLSKSPKLQFKNSSDINDWIFWVLAASVAERYSGAGGDTKLEKDIKFAREREIEELIEILHDEERRFKSVDETNKRIEFLDKDNVKKSSLGKSMVYKLYRLMIKDKGATDWNTSLQFYPIKSKQASFSPEEDHIFPKSGAGILIEQGQDGGLIDNLPNRMILMKKTNAGKGAKLPVEYLPIVFKKCPEAFKQQMVPENKGMWGVRAFNSFIELRSNLIADELNDWINGFNKNVAIKETAGVDWDNLPDEGPTVEYKASFETNFGDKEVPQEGKVAEVLKTVSAFANTKGGYIFFGISDDKNISGLSYDFTRHYRKKNRKDSLAQQIIQTINDNLEPSIYEGFANGFDGVVRWYPENAEDPDVAYIKIDPCLDEPVMYKKDIYQRVGDGDHKVTKDKISNWSKNRFK